MMIHQCGGLVSDRSSAALRPFEAESPEAPVDPLTLGLGFRV